MLKNVLHISIRTKLYVAISILVGSISVFILLFFPSRLQYQTFRTHKLRAQSIATMSAYAVTPAVVFHDSVGIREIFLSAKQNPDLAYILIEDTTGHIIVEDQLSLAQKAQYRVISEEPLPTELFLKVQCPIVTGNQQIGTLFLGISLQALQADVGHSRALVVIVSILILIIGLTVAFWIANVVTIPLQRVVDTVKKIDSGELSQRAPILWEDEVGTLAKTINQMAESIMTAQNQLEIANRSLEDRVKQRTQELRDQISEHEKTKDELQLRETIIEAIAIITQKFLLASEWRQEMKDVLQVLGKAVQASRINLFELIKQEKHTRVLTMVYEWVNSGVEPVMNGLSTSKWSVQIPDNSSQVSLLMEKEFMIWRKQEFKKYNTMLSIPDTVQSVMFAPVFVNRSWWGILSFSEDEKNRTWTTAEIDALKTVSRTLGTAIERQQAERALRQSEEQYRRFFEEDLTGNFIITPAGEIRECNPSFLQIFDFSSQENAFQENFKNLFSSEDQFLSWIKEVKNQQELIYYQMNLRKTNGRTIYAIVNAIGRFSPGGQLEEIRGYLFDDTKRRELEEQLIQSQKMEGLGTIAGGIAHDFNNILAIIEGYASLLTQSGSNAEMVREAIDAITKATTRGANLVHQLLAFARRTKTELDYLYINEVVKEVNVLLVQTFPKTIVIKNQLDAQPPPILADINQMHQVILNVSVNARDAMPNGGILQFSCKTVEGKVVHNKFPQAIAKSYLQLDISDTGIGMSNMVRKRIFEPFFTTKDVGKGTGLGLSVVFGIVQSHNGFIDVQSNENIGTTFSFYFPVVEIVELRDITVDTGSPEQLMGTETILFVEDEEDLQKFVSLELERYGYTIISAQDSWEALSTFRQNESSIDLVLTDMGLPRISGEQLSNQIKLIKPEKPIIIASGYIAPDLVTRLQKVGIHHMIQKPYKMQVLLKMIRNALEGK